MKNKKIGFTEAFSLGVGGMVGGGIFAVLGLTISLAKGAAPLAFMFAGLIALVTAYSYVKLSLRYPSEGGTIEFIVQAYGNRLFASLVNTLMLISYNALHTPQSLMSSLLVILAVILFELFYRRLRDGLRPMSSFMDKRLERVETSRDKS